jgi:uncharacterized protein YjbI with pentapeptide repeats
MAEYQQPQKLQGEPHAPLAQPAIDFSEEVTLANARLGAGRGEETEPRWGDLPDPARQEELDASLRAWEQLSAAERAERKGPFAPATDEQVAELQLGGDDVFYLAAWVLAGPARDRVAWEAAVAQLRMAQDDPPFLVGLGLSALHLEGADLTEAHLERADLTKAHLEDADLSEAHLEGARLTEAHLERADFSWAHLEGTRLSEAHLEGAHFLEAHLEGARLTEAHLEGARLLEAHLEGVDLRWAHLEGAVLTEDHLEGTSLTGAHLEGADLTEAHLEGKMMAADDLARIRGWAADFPERLSPADLRGASFDKASRLQEAVLTGVSFDQVTFDNTNLTVVDWSLVDRLGDERTARARTGAGGQPKDRDTRLAQFKAAVRANRQLAVALQAQGLSEDASRFAYRAQVLQRQVLRRQRKLGAYLFSLLLAVLAGYGYRLWRIFAIYGLTVTAFASAYLAAGLAAGHASLTLQSALDALQVSLNAIHGRVFFAQFGLDTLQSWLATGESILGIVIEGVFVAMLIQRFFGR